MICVLRCVLALLADQLVLDVLLAVHGIYDIHAVTFGLLLGVHAIAMDPFHIFPPCLCVLRLTSSAPFPLFCRFRQHRQQVDKRRVTDPESGLFGEWDVVANRDLTVGDMGPYSGMVLHDSEVLRYLRRPRQILRAMHFMYSISELEAENLSIYPTFDQVRSSSPFVVSRPLLPGSVIANLHACPMRLYHHPSPPACSSLCHMFVSLYAR